MTRCLLATFLLAGLAAHAQTISGDLSARDVMREFKLPPLQDQPQDEVWKSASQLQVLGRAQRLHLNAQSATAAWAEAQDTYREALKSLSQDQPHGQPRLFSGTRASQLNVLLQQAGTSHVKVTSTAINLDEPIRIARSGLTLDLGNAELRSQHLLPYMIRVQGADHINISSAHALSGRWLILIARSHHVQVSGMSVRNAEGGVLITSSTEVTVAGNRFAGMERAAVLLLGDTQRAVIVGNEILSGHGSSNWMAGVVLTDRNADVDKDPDTLLLDDKYWVAEQPMAQRTAVPEANLIVDNHIADNASSGIYSDGSARNVIFANRIEGNSKEGLCLDDGSIANVVAFNLLRRNGERWGKSDGDLELDFVSQFGRLPNGNSPAKVPAISVDNAAYNQVVFNQVDGNFGGGIKLVRTDFYNLVGINTITNNNAGQSVHFHFFGIELGAATSDRASKELDFTPSRGNQIFGNIIRGDHYAGIFFAEGSVHNDIFDNAIFGASNWAMESLEIQPNVVLNNITNLPLRNMGSGLDPKLLRDSATPNSPEPSVAPQ